MVKFKMNKILIYNKTVYYKIVNKNKKKKVFFINYDILFHQIIKIIYHTIYYFKVNLLNDLNSNDIESLFL